MSAPQKPYWQVLGELNAADSAKAKCKCGEPAKLGHWWCQSCIDEAQSKAQETMKQGYARRAKERYDLARKRGLCTRCKKPSKRSICGVCKDIKLQQKQAREEAANA